jgi:flagellar biosynthesis/type III secretory pathway protein FliH
MNFKKNQEIDKNIAQIIEKAQNQSYEQGKTEGFALGLTRGEFQTKIEIAKKMAENKIDFSTIAKCVNLPVSKIKQELKHFDNTLFSYSKANQFFALA